MYPFSRFRSLVGKNKYWIVLALFALLAGFLDENSLVRRFGYARQINHLRGEIEHYRAIYEANTEQLSKLISDTVSIERIAREKYLMKKPDEDIYLFKEDLHP
ncbi:MAG: septum formation initiator family protein [Prevotellaceae bacterium]|jgi:cell division protein FtsB|nr:septum formation initiator family protein [Prevotellaceae bacterium]